MQQVFYAVRKGRVPAIYITWEDCQKQVKGFSGAEFKKFHNLEDAKEFIKYDKNKLKKPCVETHIWCDGSYSNDVGMAGYGFVITQNDEVIYSDNGIVDDSDFIKARNVAGEIQGALSALEWCKENGISEVQINYDYTGIEEFGTGRWQGRTPVSKYYQNSLKEYSDITIHYNKIKAHSGVKYNEMADKLATKALININDNSPRMR